MHLRCKSDKTEFLPHEAKKTDTMKSRASQESHKKMYGMSWAQKPLPYLGFRLCQVEESGKLQNTPALLHCCGFEFCFDKKNKHIISEYRIYQISEPNSCNKSIAACWPKAEKDLSIEFESVWYGTVSLVTYLVRLP